MKKNSNLKSTLLLLLLCISFNAFAQKDGIYNITAYGAKGDGKSDCSDAFQKAINAIIKDGGGQLFIPKGDFILKKKVSSLDNQKVTLSIVGLGVGVSNILCSNQEGGLHISYFDTNSQITMRDFTLWAMREGAGTAVEIEHKRKGNAHHRALIVDNVEMRSRNINKDYFDYGFRALNVWRPIFTASVFAGPYGKTISNNRKEDSPLYKAEVAFDVSGSYAPRFSNCYAWSAKVGYKLVDMDNPGAEDGTLLNSFAVECAIGIDAETKGTEPQLLIDGGHYNCRDIGIRIVGRKFVNIVNCLMYNVDIDTQASQYVDIYLEKCNNIIITNNIFHFKGQSNRDNVVVTGKSYDIDILNNRFNAHANAVKVEQGCSTVRVLGNGFASYVNKKLIDKTQNGVETDLKK